MELEIDSYKGLVDELSTQADALIDSNHPDSKIVKNRMVRLKFLFFKLLLQFHKNQVKFTTFYLSNNTQFNN